MEDPIPALHEEFKGVLACLGEHPSLHRSAEDIFRKYLLLAVASYFEKRLTDEVEGFVASVTSENHVLTHLVSNKAVKRQYHTWFAWKEDTAHNFFRLFGPDFLAHMKKELSENQEMVDSIRAFMEIGRDRNRLIHGALDDDSKLKKTSGDVYNFYTRALRFVKWFPVALAEFAKKQSSPAE